MNQAKIDKWIRYLLSAAFFLPLLYTPGVLFPYQYGKVLLFEAFIGITMAIWLAYGRKERFSFSPVFWVFAAFLVVRLVTGFLGDNPEKSFWGDHIRMTGNFTYLFFFFFFILLRENFRGNNKEFSLLSLIAATGALGALLAVFQRYLPAGKLVFGGSGDWLYGSFGNPAYLAGYLLLVIFFTTLFAFRQSQRNRKLFWSAIAMGEIILLVATSTRGAVVGLLAGAVAAGIVILAVSRRKTWRWFGVAGIILPILVVAGSLFIYFGPGRESLPGRVLGSLLRVNTAETRIINWRIALDGFKAKPFAGWGPENYEIIFSKFYRPELINYTWNETWSDRPHNIVLEVASGSGILGIVSYLFLFFVPLFMLFRKARSGTVSVSEAALCVGGIIAFLAQGFFFFDTFGTLLLFSALLAFIDMRFLEKAEDGRLRGTGINSKVRPILSVIILGSMFWGVLLPARASHLAYKAEKALGSRDYSGFETYLKRSLKAWTPHRDDLAKIFADDILKGDNAGFIPLEVTKSVLPEMAAYLKERSDAHSRVFALSLRSGQTYSLMGEYLGPEYFKNAEEMFKRAGETSPLRQTRVISEALLETARGNYTRAAELTGSLLETSPKYAETYLMHGTALHALGDNDGAEKMFDHLIELSPIIQGSSKAATWRINYFVLDFYASRGHIEKMAPILEAMIKDAEFALYPDLHLRLAAVYTALGRYDEARAEALKIISLDPGKRADVEELIGAIYDLSNRK